MAQLSCALAMQVQSIVSGDDGKQPQLMRGITSDEVSTSTNTVQCVCCTACANICNTEPTAWRTVRPTLPTLWAISPKYNYIKWMTSKPPGLMKMRL